jgi:hypothetical protein
LLWQRFSMTICCGKTGGESLTLTAESPRWSHPCCGVKDLRARSAHLALCRSAVSQLRRWASMVLPAMLVVGHHGSSRLDPTIQSCPRPQIRRRSSRAKSVKFGKAMPTMLGDMPADCWMGSYSVLRTHIFL